MDSIHLFKHLSFFKLDLLRDLYLVSCREDETVWMPVVYTYIYFFFELRFMFLRDRIHVTPALKLYCFVILTAENLFFTNL